MSPPSFWPSGYGAPGAGYPLPVNAAGTTSLNQQAGDLKPAQVLVTLPAEAKLYFENTPTQKTSDRREFETPLLSPGRTYHYKLKAELTVDGKTRVETRTIEVRAGQRSAVIFAFPTAVAGK